MKKILNLNQNKTFSLITSNTNANLLFKKLNCDFSFKLLSNNCTNGIINNKFCILSKKNYSTAENVTLKRHRNDLNKNNNRNNSKYSNDNDGSENRNQSDVNDAPRNKRIRNETKSELSDSMFNKNHYKPKPFKLNINNLESCDEIIDFYKKNKKNIFLENDIMIIINRFLYILNMKDSNFTINYIYESYNSSKNSNEKEESDISNIYSQNNSNSRIEFESKIDLFRLFREENLFNLLSSDNVEYMSKINFLLYSSKIKNHDNYIVFRSAAFYYYTIIKENAFNIYDSLIYNYCHSLINHLDKFSETTKTNYVISKYLCGDINDFETNTENSNLLRDKILLEIKTNKIILRNFLIHHTESFFDSVLKNFSLSGFSFTSILSLMRLINTLPYKYFDFNERLLNLCYRKLDLSEKNIEVLTHKVIVDDILLNNEHDQDILNKILFSSIKKLHSREIKETINTKRYSIEDFESDDEGISTINENNKQEINRNDGNKQLADKNRNNKYSISSKITISEICDLATSHTKYNNFYFIDKFIIMLRFLDKAFSNFNDLNKNNNEDKYDSQIAYDYFVFFDNEMRNIRKSKIQNLLISLNDMINKKYLKVVEIENFLYYVYYHISVKNKSNGYVLSEKEEDIKSGNQLNNDNTNNCFNISNSNPNFLLSLINLIFDTAIAQKGANIESLFKSSLMTSNLDMIFSSLLDLEVTSMYPMILSKYIIIISLMKDHNFSLIKNLGSSKYTSILNILNNLFNKNIKKIDKMIKTLLPKDQINVLFIVMANEKFLLENNYLNKNQISKLIQNTIEIENIIDIINNKFKAHDFLDCLLKLFPIISLNRVEEIVNRLLFFIDNENIDLDISTYPHIIHLQLYTTMCDHLIKNKKLAKTDLYEFSLNNVSNLKTKIRFIRYANSNINLLHESCCLNNNQIFIANYLLFKLSGFLNNKMSLKKSLINVRALANNQIKNSFIRLPFLNKYYYIHLLNIELQNKLAQKKTSKLFLQKNKISSDNNLVIDLIENRNSNIINFICNYNTFYLDCFRIKKNVYHEDNSLAKEFNIFNNYKDFLKDIKFEFVNQISHYDCNTDVLVDIMKNQEIIK